MKLAHTRERERQAFTLIELLVVILIIGILAALITAAASKAIALANRTKNRVEIGELETAVESFKTRYHVSYIPSRILLSESGAGYTTGSQLANDSIQYLMQVWPRLPFVSGVGFTTPIDWNGDGQLSPDVILEGDQCLVFFLGGIPDNVTAGAPPAVTGFSTYGSNPAYHIANPGTDVNPPLFEFNSNRLVRQLPGGSPLHLGASSYYSYLDTYGQSNGSGQITSGAPYAYFSSYKLKNSYNRYVQTYGSDCATLGTNFTQVGVLWPYAEATSAVPTPAIVPPPARYLKPDTFQIISVGADGAFGPGSVPQYNAAGVFTGFAPTWTPATASSVFPQGAIGYYNQANFSSSPLGVGAE